MCFQYPGSLYVAIHKTRDGSIHKVTSDNSKNNICTCSDLVNELEEVYGWQWLNAINYFNATYMIIMILLFTQKEEEKSSPEAMEGTLPGPLARVPDEFETKSMWKEWKGEQDTDAMKSETWEGRYPAAHSFDESPGQEEV